MNDQYRNTPGLLRSAGGTDLGWFPVPWDASGLTQTAFGIVNPEGTSSAVGIVGLFERDAARVRQDKDLSAQGQRARIAALAKSRLENLSPLARKVIEIEAAYRAGETEALRLPEPSANDTAIDLALAAHVRESGESAVRLRLLADDRTKLAIARLPAVLGGLTAEHQAKVRHSLLPPSVAQRLDDESQSVAAARQTVQKAIDALTGHAPDIAHRDLVAMFGDSWKLRGAVSQDERLARIGQLLSHGDAPAAPAGSGDAA